jgi:GNAT superfamily N-acetyltransferase
MISTTVLTTIRPALRSDRAAIEAMWERCSLRTRNARFLGGTVRIPAAYFERVLEPRPHDRHLVALVAPGHVVALASRCEGELAVLVEDEWQGGGIGTALEARLAA